MEFPLFQEIVNLVQLTECTIGVPDLMVTDSDPILGVRLSLKVLIDVVQHQVIRPFKLFEPGLHLLLVWLTFWTIRQEASVNMNESYLLAIDDHVVVPEEVVDSPAILAVLKFRHQPIVVVVVVAEHSIPRQL